VDRVYLPGQKNPISLRQNSAELFLLAMARDEAHRFANEARKKAGKKRRFASQLDDVVGLGPKTRTLLLKTFGSLSAILQASDAELLATRGVTRKQVSAMRKQLQSETPPEQTASLELDEGAKETSAVSVLPPEPPSELAAPLEDANSVVVRGT
jgi:excinuclease ABC subunit C